MNDNYYINLVTEAERVIEEYTLAHGYQDYPSTSFTNECSTARWKFSEVKKKLGWYQRDIFYFQSLSGHERDRWEFEFDRKYSEYLEAMENWLELPPEFYDYSLSPDIDRIHPPSPSTFDIKTLLSVAIIMLGLGLMFYLILPKNPAIQKSIPTIKND